MMKKVKNLNNAETPKLGISDVIHSILWVGDYKLKK
jgi:hypothetical protein